MCMVQPLDPYVLPSNSPLKEVCLSSSWLLPSRHPSHAVRVPGSGIDVLPAGGGCGESECGHVWPVVLADAEQASHIVSSRVTRAAIGGQHLHQHSLQNIAQGPGHKEGLPFLPPC